MHFYIILSPTRHKITDCNIDLLFTTYKYYGQDKTRQDKNDNTNTMKLSIAVVTIICLRHCLNAVSAGKAGKNSKGSKTTKTSKATSLSLSYSMSIEPTFKRCDACISTGYEIDCPTDNGYCEFTFLASTGPVDPIKCEKPSTPCTPTAPNPPCALCSLQALALPENTCASTSFLDNCIVEYPEDGPVTCEVVDECPVPPPPPDTPTITICTWCAMAGGVVPGFQGGSCPTIDGTCEITIAAPMDGQMTFVACESSPQCDLNPQFEDFDVACDSCTGLPSIEFFFPKVSELVCPQSDEGDVCLVRLSQDAPTTCEVIGQSTENCPAADLVPLIDSLEDIAKKTHLNNL